MNRYDALQHAIKAHGPETDWCGKLYIFHPMAVADRIDANWKQLEQEAAYWGTSGVDVEDAVIVALLHDVLEDTKYMLDPDDFTCQQWEALQLVTHEPGYTYREYVERIARAAEAGRKLATVVKLADLSHNMSAERKVNLSEQQAKDAASLEEKRYRPSRDRLWAALGSEWWPA